MNEAQYKFKLYVVDQSEETIEKTNLLKELFESALKSDYTLEVVDMLENPEMIADNQIKISPTLMLELPPPPKKVEGSIPGDETLLLALNILNKK